MDKFKLYVQAGLSFTLLIFCLVQLVRQPSNNTLYWGGVMAIVGYWMPSPKGA